jgi:hypothetical protein
MAAKVEFDFEDLAKRHPGDLEMFPREYVEQQIADVVGRAEAEVPGIQDRIAAGKLTAVVYKRVIADAVNRVLLNPFGRSNENEGGFGFGRDTQVASGRIEFPEGDKQLLRGQTAGRVLLGTARMGLAP